MSTNGNNTLLKVRDLKTYFRTEDGTVKAVDGVSFDLHRGETLGIVGESGSGKSVTNLSILRLVPQPPGEVTGGEVIFEGKDLLKMPEKDLRDIRGGQIAMIFQDPMTSLNPFMRVSSQLMEVTRLHLGYGRKQAREHAVRMLELVGIPDAKSRVDDYPHQFSGGMRQRVMIAMALACRPKLLIADEPTTALDVTIQAQILELIKEMKEETGTSVILITHDLGLVAGMTDHVVVMYAGHVFETAPTAELFRNPQNPYTRALLRSVPDPTREGEELFQIAGLPPDLARLSPDRCPFAERCPEVIDMCREAFPPYHKVDDDHWTLCWVR
jgi:oligopeptide transport system ATP-binding protein